MEFPDLVKKLEADKVFKDWAAAHGNNFLAHVFVTIVNDSAAGYQVGYYDTATDQITSFVVEEGKEIAALPASEVLKDPNAPILALELEGVSMSTEDVLAKAHAVRDEEYKGIPSIKVFFILQHIKDLGNIFNVTFVTQQLQTLNVKLNAQSGEVLHHSLASLIQQDDGSL